MAYMATLSLLQPNSSIFRGSCSDQHHELHASSFPERVPGTQYARVACCYPSDLDTIPEGQGAERATVWRKEGYHDDYTKSPILPDDRDDITEYVELLAMLHSPRESFARA